MLQMQFISLMNNHEAELPRQHQGHIEKGLGVIEGYECTSSLESPFLGNLHKSTLNLNALVSLPHVS